MCFWKLIQSRARLKKTEQILSRPWRIWPQSSFFLRHECNWHHNGMADVVQSKRLLRKRSTWLKRHWFATWPEGKFEIRSEINLPPGSHCTWRVHGPSWSTERMSSSPLWQFKAAMVGAKWPFFRFSKSIEGTITTLRGTSQLGSNPTCAGQRDYRKNKKAKANFSLTVPTLSY